MYIYILCTRHEGFGFCKDKRALTTLIIYIYVHIIYILYTQHIIYNVHDVHDDNYLAANRAARENGKMRIYNGAGARR